MHKPTNCSVSCELSSDTDYINCVKLTYLKLSVLSNVTDLIPELCHVAERLVQQKDGVVHQQVDEAQEDGRVGRLDVPLGSLRQGAGRTPHGQ